MTPAFKKGPGVGNRQEMAVQRGKRVGGEKN